MARKRLPTEARRAQIADAALKIIGEQGVHRLTVAEIGREVGLADGSIFRHFPSKQAIVEAAIARFEELLFQDFPPSDPDPMVRLETFVKARIELLRTHPIIVRLALNDRLTEAAGQEMAQRIQGSVLRSFLFVRDCLAEAQARGQVPDTVPVEVLVWVVTGVMRGMGMMFLSGIALLPDHAVWPAIERLLRLAAAGEQLSAADAASIPADP